MRAGHVLAVAGTVAVGATAYRRRWELRERALVALAHGSPVVMNVTMDEGTVVLDDSNGGVMVNVDLRAVDYGPIRAATEELLDVIRDRQSSTVLVQAKGTSNTRITSSNFTGNGFGIGASL